MREMVCSRQELEEVLHDLGFRSALWQFVEKRAQSPHAMLHFGPLIGTMAVNAIGHTTTAAFFIRKHASDDRAASARVREERAVERDWARSEIASRGRRRQDEQVESSIGAIAVLL